ncbi:MAG: hypothetical protein AABZ44_04420, partial [Elusimicrobiota bacterium]
MNGIAAISTSLRGRLAGHLPFLALAALTACVYLCGVSWGVPSRARSDLLLKPEQRTADFFTALKRTRERRYQDFQYGNQFATVGYEFQEHGQGDIPYFKKEAVAYEELILHSYSAFLIRSLDSDEQNLFILLSNLRPRGVEWVVAPSWYGGFYLYSLGAALGAAKVAGFIKLVPDITYYYEHPEEMGKLFVAGRVWSVLAAWLCVLAIYLFVSEVFGRTAAAWAAFFWIASPLPLSIAHIAKPHPLACALSVLGFLGSVMVYKTGSRRWYLATGLAYGLAFASSYSVVSSVWLLPVMHIARLYGRRELTWRRAVNLDLVLATLVALAAWIATCPYVYLRFDEWRYTLKGMSAVVEHRGGALSPTVWLRCWRNTIPPQADIVILVLCAVGCLRGVVRGGAVERILAGYLAYLLLWYALTFGSEGANSVYNARHFLIGFVLVFAFAAHGLSGLLQVRRW